MVQIKNDSQKSDYLSKIIKELDKEAIKIKYFLNIFNLILIHKKQNEIIDVNYTNNHLNPSIKKEKFNTLSLYKFKTIILKLPIMHFIFALLFSQIFSIQINPDYSYIFLKVNKTGNIKILESGTCSHEQPSPRLPNEIYINDVKKNSRSYSYSFTASPNNITLIWHNPLKAVGCMFLGCKDIIEMDFSHFKTSEINCFAGMFNGCSSLTSLNLSNFDTSQATSITYMFNKCSSLISLDLSNFNTEKVNDDDSFMDGCSSLKYLNIKNAVVHQNFINRIKSLPSFQNIYISNKYINDFKNENNKLIDCIIFDEFNLSKTYHYYYIYSKQEKFNCSYCGYEFYEINSDINNSESDNNQCHQKLENKEQFYSENIIHINDSLNLFLENFVDNLDLSDLSQGKDEEMRKNNIFISFTTLNKKNNYSDDNKININLKKCEKILKDFYNISYNDSLYILIVEIKLDKIRIPIIEYEVYYPLFNNKLFQLNLSLCNKEKIDLLIPVILNDSIEKYDPKSNYYNDICSKATSNSGTDINLNDRKNEYFENNMMLCEENCELINYNDLIKKVNCSCEIKVSLPTIEEIKFDKNALFKRFKDIKNIANINILKCFKNVFSINCIKKNYGFLIFTVIILFFIISTFIFYIKNYFYIKKEIYDIIMALRNMNLIYKKNKYNKIKTRNSQNNNKLKKSKTFKKMHKKSDKLKNLILKTESINDLINENFKNKTNENYNREDEKYRKILEYNDNEINSLPYKEALKMDKRTFFQYYFSLLRTGHPFLFSFYNNIDYNARIIKIFLFFFFFAENFTINALFFNDDTMHKIYIDEGAFNFIYQLPQIIYSTIISNIIDYLVKFLALSEDNILKLKQEKNNDSLNKNKNILIKVLKVKFALFFVLTFILLLIFLYYITCFCGVYVNTQVHLIKDTVISFAFSFFYPFIIYLFPSIFRIYSLRHKKQDKNYSYQISILFQML